MWADILPSIITGAVTLIGVIMANNVKYAVLEEKIENLTREVREHNNFAQRVPVLENKVENLEKSVK